MNILYLHSHDTGRYIQPYGYPVPTPHLQRLAEQGTLFRKAFTVNPTCSPSRAALLTGTWPHENGMVGLAHRGFSLNDYTEHIVHLLKQHGYATALAGVQHVAASDVTGEAWQKIGYDEYLGNAGEAHTKAAQFLEDRPSEPFFLSVGFSLTHRKFPEQTPNFDPRYCRAPEPLPDTPETRLDFARFKESARDLDRRMGAVLEALDRAGLADNTLVVCTTDHGIAFPRMKCNLQDSGTGIMLILRGPGSPEASEGNSGHFNGGKVVAAMVTHMDIFPTICELAGIDKPARLRGRSLLPLVSGETESIHETIFTEVNYHAAYEPMRAVRTDRYKYIRRFGNRQNPVLPNCDDSLSKDLWRAAGWENQKYEAESLYDLVFDPNESANLAAVPDFAEVLKDMRGRLAAWMERTGDPLLSNGTVPAPAGAVVNDPDGTSPRERPHRV